VEANKKLCFTFQFKLPKKPMPRVCRHPDGKVFYSAEAMLKRPSIFKSNLKETEEFFIMTNVNLNSFNDADEPGRTTESWTNSIFCCCKRNRVIITCSTPYKGVCPGKMIPFQINANNQTRRTINDITVELVQKWVYWCSGNTKRVNRTVKKLTRTFKVPPRSNLEWKDSLRVPADLFQPTQGTNLCRIINVDYVLKFTPVQDCSFSCGVPALEIPIYIGDIPLAIHSYSDTHGLGIDHHHGRGESVSRNVSKMSIHAMSRKQWDNVSKMSIGGPKKH